MCIEITELPRRCLSSTIVVKCCSRSECRLFSIAFVGHRIRLLACQDPLSFLVGWLGGELWSSIGINLFPLAKSRLERQREHSSRLLSCSQIHVFPAFVYVFVKPLKFSAVSFASVALRA